MRQKRSGRGPCAWTLARRRSLIRDTARNRVPIRFANAAGRKLSADHIEVSLRPGIRSVTGDYADQPEGWTSVSVSATHAGRSDPSTSIRAVECSSTEPPARNFAS
jgi:hypothetical protein